MKKIKLSQGKYALVDDEDFSRLSKRKWSAAKQADGTFYAVGYLGTINKKETNEYMHRVIMNCPKGKFIDHINHNKLDNRKKNLRICSIQENNRNMKIFRNNTSGYKGVYLDKNAKSKKWLSQFYLNGKSFKSSWKTVEEAAKAYNEAVKKHFGEFALLNKITKHR
jgi:hypothetical protein